MSEKKIRFFMRKLSKTKVLISILVLILIIAGVVSFAGFWSEKPTLRLSGEVRAKEIRNGSRLGGRVKKIYAREGDNVKAGTVLVVFDDTDLQAKIAEAKASLVQAMAQERLLAKGADLGQVRQAGAVVDQARERLKLVTSGARPEEIAQVQSRVRTAEIQADQARKVTENARVMLDEGIISRQKYASLQDQLNTANSALEAARAALQMAKSGGRREERKVADAQLSAARAQYNQLLRGAPPEEIRIATANVDKARSALSALEAQRNETQIRAPFDGMVSVIAVTEGELVQPGRSVITITDYAHLWTDVFVPESKLLALSLHPGNLVLVHPRSDTKSTFQGKISLVSAQSEFIPNSGGDSSTEEQTFRVKIGIDRRDVSGKKDLYPGMKVDVVFPRTPS